MRKAPIRSEEEKVGELPALSLYEYSTESLNSAHQEYEVIVEPESEFNDVLVTFTCCHY